MTQPPDLEFQYAGGAEPIEAAPPVGPPWWSATSLFSPEGTALASLIITSLSLLSVTGIGVAAEAEQYDHGGPQPTWSLIMLSGGHVLLALLGLWLAARAVRRDWASDDTASWVGAVGRAAIVVGVLSLLMHLGALGFALTMTTPEGGFVSG